MADEEQWYSPNRKPQSPPKPTPGEHMWTLRKGTDTLSAELRTHKETGVELKLLRNGELVYGRRHAMRALALAEAAVARQQYEADGWIEKGGA